MNSEEVVLSSATLLESIDRYMALVDARVRMEVGQRWLLMGVDMISVGTVCNVLAITGIRQCWERLSTQAFRHFIMF